MYKRILLIVLVCCVLSSSICLAAPKRIGKTNVGTLAILTECVDDDRSTVGVIFAMSEEIYTNPYFLERLQKDIRFKDVIGCWKVYAFNDKENEYVIAGIEYFNELRQSVISKEGDNTIRQIKSDKEAQAVYKAALKELKIK